MEHWNNYEKWMASPLVDDATKAELAAIRNHEQEVADRFSQILDFGTAGLRGIMRAGLNGMNVYTVRYATQGLANLIQTCGEDDSGGVTIAYDSRHNSRLFAEEAASVLAAAGIPVSFFEALRPTPELSFAIRETGSIAGINITASHNTKEYNGYKVYWSDGAQLPPEHAAKVSAQLGEIDFFAGVQTMDFGEAASAGRIRFLGKDMDERYLAAVEAQSVGRADVDRVADSFSLIFTPFHGAGYQLVPEVLQRIGLQQVWTVPEQMVLDGDFPTVKSPNPENVEGFALAIAMAREKGVDLIIGTDPDGDRCGVVVRSGDGYQTLTGNQIGALLLDFLITKKREAGALPANSAAVKSIVSTTMANQICADNGIALIETLTGFKYIGEKIKEFEATGTYTYLFGFEESNGYLAGTYARDKDAIVASMLIAEMACWYRGQGKTLYEAMEALYEKYGYFQEQVVSYTMEGFDGKEKTAALMAGLREQPPEALGGLSVLRIRDYQTGQITTVATGASEATGLPASNVLFYDLEGGCSAIVRPSGTEPKVKLYVMVQAADRQAALGRLDAILASADALLQDQQ